jgi:NADPH-dependent curcumin reductase CurA
MGIVNRKVVLVSRPDGRPDDSNFRYLEEDVAPLEDGQVLVAVDLLGIDAFIRTTLNEGSFHRGAQIGGVIPALGVGEVLDSRDAGFVAGDKVFGPLSSQTHAVMPAFTLRKLDTAVAPANAWLGALGLTTGLTAYFGIVDVGRVKKGDTVVVSGAAGAVGSMAGQIARPEDVTRPRSWWRNSDSTPPSTTATRTSVPDWTSWLRMASTCSSTTSAARFSTTC